MKMTVGLPLTAAIAVLFSSLPVCSSCRFICSEKVSKPRRFVSGSVDSQWGALRADRGHPEPWNLTYFAIGNEVRLLSKGWRYSFMPDRGHY